MKKIKKTLLYLFGFAALLLTITVIINLPAFDEDLLPEVAAIKNIQAESFSEANAYPALLAINSASGQSLQEATEEVRRFLNQKIETTGIDYLDSEAYNKLIGRGHDKSWQNLYISCNSRSDTSCMAKLHQELKQNPISDERLIEQLTRYDDFIEYTQYKELTQLDLNAFLGPFATLTKLKRIFVANAYANQTAEMYLDKLFKDMNFWRMVLKKSNLMLTKMIAVATLSDDINSISAVINQDALDSQQLTQLQTHIKTLNSTEIDMGTTIDFEFKYSMSLFDDAEAVSPVGMSEWINFFQPKATHNTTYLYNFKPLKKVTSLNTVEFHQYLKSNQQHQDFVSPVSWSLSMLYNPTGKLLVGSTQVPAYNDYIGRVHDLNGMFHLLKLQIEIALNPDRPVEQVINESQYTNPYTLEPMSYKKDSHSIHFKCMDKTSSCELDL